MQLQGDGPHEDGGQRQGGELPAKQRDTETLLECPPLSPAARRTREQGRRTREQGLGRKVSSRMFFVFFSTLSKLVFLKKKHTDPGSLTFTSFTPALHQFSDSSSIMDCNWFFCLTSRSELVLTMVIVLYY